MKRIASLLFLAPLGLAAAGAAGPSIVGTWDVNGVDARGVRTHLTMIVQQTADKLSGTLRTDDGYDLPLLEPKFETGEFRFQLRINPTELVTVTLKLDGDRLEGKFQGTDSGGGTVKATRVVPPSLSGIWTGEWEISPDGRPGPHYMVLKQDGDQVTGTVGPNEQTQLSVEHGKFTGGHLTFDISIPGGPSLAFDFTVHGDSMSGTAVLKMNGTEQRLTLTAKRAQR